MGKSKFFSIALAAALLAGCSNDDVVSDNGQLNIKEGGQMQVALNFGPQTRAASYDKGSEAESVVKNAQFYFFNKADGKYLGTSGLLTTFGQKESDGNVERLVDVNVPVNAVEALKKGNADVTVVAVLNAPSDFKADTTKTINEFNKATTSVGATNLGFMMTNSVYAAYSKVTENIASKDDNVTVSSANVYNVGQKPAGYQPVTMYVERVCAKVKLNLNEEANTTTEDGKFEVKSWALNVTNNKYYPLKKIANIFSAANVAVPNLWANVTNNGVKGWSNAADHRSFWAEDPNYNDKSNGYKSDFKIVPITELTNKLGDSEYCLENTFSNEAQNTNQTTTAVIMTQFTMKDGKVTDIVLYENKKYTAANFLNTVMGENNAALKKYWKKEGNNYKQLSTSDFVLAAGEGEKDITVNLGNNVTVIGSTNGRYIQFAEGVGDIYKDVKKNADGTISATKVDAATALASIAPAKDKYTVFVNGFSYYEIPIRHFDDMEVPLVATDVNGASQIGRYGVVRNHTYNLTINSVSNLGNPITGETIEPGSKPDDKTDFRMDVSIDVLSWAYRSQGIDL